MVPNAMANRAPAGSHPATTSPEDRASRQETHDVSLRVEADGVAGNDHERAGQRIGDLVDDALEHWKPQRENDGIDIPQRVMVVDGDDGSSTDSRSQRSRRLAGAAREPQGLAAEASRRAIADPIPPVPMMAVVISETSSVSRALRPGASRHRSSTRPSRGVSSR